MRLTTSVLVPHNFTHHSNDLSLRPATKILWRSVLSTLLGLLLIVGNLMTGLTQFASAAEGGSVDFEQTKRQGITYFNNNMYPLAKKQFDLAYQTAEGKNDFVVVYYRGFLAERDLRLEVAFEMAEMAASLGSNDEEKVQAQQLLDQLKGRFGYVKISPAAEETNKEGRIYLETKRRIINKQKREQFESIRMRFRSMDVTVPTKIYLPYGRYTANNVPFEIRRNSDEVPEVSLFLHIIKDERDQSGGGAWLYTGIGVTGAALIGVGAYFLLKPEPSVVDQTTFSFPKLNP